MDQRTQKRFRAMWARDVPLADIASALGYSFQSLAKWRMLLALPKRYGAPDDGDMPTLDVIRLRCEQQQTNWSEHDRRLRWRGTPHTIYHSISTHDCEP